MEKIRFLNSKNESERIISYCQIRKVNNNTIRLTFDKELPDNELFSHGFDIINENNDENMSDDYYHNYITIYKKIDNEMSILLSNDGSVYIEPEITKPEPYVPTEEELKVIFENNKKAKVLVSKTLLATYLETHPLMSDCHNRVMAEYTVTSEKQALMANNYLTYTIAKESGVENPTLTWNAARCECEEWKEEEYIALVLQISEYVKPLVSLQQTYEISIRNCTTQEELDAIDIVYDVYGIAE